MHADGTQCRALCTQAASLRSVGCSQGRKNHCVAVIGDGAITGGMAYEAMNHAGFLDKNMIVVLNDNQQVCATGGVHEMWQAHGLAGNLAICGYASLEVAADKQSLPALQRLPDCSHGWCCQCLVGASCEVLLMHQPLFCRKQALDVHP